MTPEIHDSIKELKLLTDPMIAILMVFDEERFAKFEEESRIYQNGTMTPILLHHMGMNDLNASQKNLKHAMEVSKKLRELKALLIRVKEEDLPDVA